MSQEKQRPLSQKETEWYLNKIQEVLLTAQGVLKQVETHITNQDRQNATIKLKQAFFGQQLAIALEKEMLYWKEAPQTLAAMKALNEQLSDAFFLKYVTSGQFTTDLDNLNNLRKSKE